MQPQQYNQTSTAAMIHHPHHIQRRISRPKRERRRLVIPIQTFHGWQRSPIMVVNHMMLAVQQRDALVQTTYGETSVHMVIIKHVVGCRRMASLVFGKGVATEEHLQGQGHNIVAWQRT